MPTRYFCKCGAPIDEQCKFLTSDRPWHEAIIDELVVDCILEAEHLSNPTKAIQDAINWNMQVALDPAVSMDARLLIRRGRISGFILGFSATSLLALAMALLL